jgi:hypothetical protein
MQEAVSSILIGRSREADGLSRMILISLVIHGVLMTALVLVPRDWLRMRPGAGDADDDLAGPSGTADAGNMASQRAGAVAADASHCRGQRKTPNAGASAGGQPKTREAGCQAGRQVDEKPSTVRGSGAARAVARTRVLVGGARRRRGSTGGVRHDVASCCRSTSRRWRRIIAGITTGHGWPDGCKVHIRRDGMLTNVEVEKTSGNALLDFESRRAVLQTRQLPPLPDLFTRPALTVYLTLDYKR